MRRMPSLGSAISSLVAFAVGMTTLLSLLLGDNPELFGEQPGREILAERIAAPGDVMLRLATLMVALSIVLGVANLLHVHVLRLRRHSLTSAVLLASFAFTLYWHVAQGDATLLEAVLVPIESALAALLCLSLVHGASRVLQKRADIWGALFVLVVIIVLLGSLGLAELAPVQTMRDWLMAVPVSAGARAILLGIALGVIVAGLRALLGQDRAYRG